MYSRDADSFGDDDEHRHHHSHPASRARGAFQVQTASMAATLFVTSTTTALFFVVQGTAPPGYAFFLAASTGVGAIFGVSLMAWAIRRSGRPSLAVLLLAGAILGSGPGVSSCGVSVSGVVPVGRPRVGPRWAPLESTGIIPDGPSPNQPRSSVGSTPDIDPGSTSDRHQADPVSTANRPRSFSGSPSRRPFSPSTVAVGFRRASVSSGWVVGSRASAQDSRAAGAGVEVVVSAHAYGRAGLR